MGITGLKDFLKDAKRTNVNITEWTGKSIAVDASCFLYRGLYAEANDVSNGKVSNNCVDFMVRTAKFIAGAGIHTIWVFDGQYLPSKKGTNDKRSEMRKEQLELLRRCKSTGDEEGALNAARKSMAVTPEVKAKVMKALNKLNHVDCIVAPYEADAQLAFLALNGIVDAIATGDSDLLVFGCSKVIFDLGPNNCVVNLYESANFNRVQIDGEPQFKTLEELRFMCIMRGCDYFSGLAGMGLKKAAKYFNRHQSRDPNKFLCSWLNQDKKIKIDSFSKLRQDFIEANNTFLYQIVFDPRDRRQKPLNAYPDSLLGVNNRVKTLEEGNSLWYCGYVQDPPIALSLALGNHPVHKNEVFDLKRNGHHRMSIWSSEKYIPDYPVECANVKDIRFVPENKEKENDDIQIVHVSPKSIRPLQNVKGNDARKKPNIFGSADLRYSLPKPKASPKTMPLMTPESTPKPTPNTVRLTKTVAEPENTSTSVETNETNNLQRSKTFSSNTKSSTFSSNTKSSTFNRRFSLPNNRSKSDSRPVKKRTALLFDDDDNEAMPNAKKANIEKLTVAESIKEDEIKFVKEQETSSSLNIFKRASMSGTPTSTNSSSKWWFQR